MEWQWSKCEHKVLSDGGTAGLFHITACCPFTTWMGGKMVDDNDRTER